LEQATPDIFGLSGGSLSGSAALQQSLESRLRARLDVNGSPEFVLTWSHWDIPSGAPICRLRASARRISAKGYSGWRTPDANKRGGGYQDAEKLSARAAAGHQINLEDQAILSGWNTPRATDGSHGGPNQAGGALPADAAKAGWPTPIVNDATGSPHCYGPKTIDGSDRAKYLKLPGAASLAGWPTPTKANAGGGQMEANCSMTGRRANGTKASVSIRMTASTVLTNGSLAPMERIGGLNPAFSLWLMGYPDEWGNYAGPATP
jgi:hypothetical protein